MVVGQGVESSIQKSHNKLLDYAATKSLIEIIGPLEFEISLYPTDAGSGALAVNPQVFEGGICYDKGVEGFFVSVATPVLSKDGTPSGRHLQRNEGIIGNRSWELTQGVVTVRELDFQETTPATYDVASIDTALSQFVTQGLSGMAGHTREFVGAYSDGDNAVSEWRLPKLKLDLKLVTRHDLDEPEVVGIWQKTRSPGSSAAWNPLMVVNQHDQISINGKSCLLGSDVVLYDESGKAVTRFRLDSILSGNREAILNNAEPPASLNEDAGIFKIVDRTVFPPKTTVRTDDGEVVVLREKTEVLYSVFLYITATLAVVAGGLFVVKKRR